MLWTLYVDAGTKKIILSSCFLQSLFWVLRNFWEGSDGTAVPSWKGSLTRDIPSIGDASWLAAFSLLVPASLPSSSWHGQSQQPDRALFCLCACAGAPGNCFWGVQPHGLNSTSCTMRSLWGIPHSWWAVCSNEANLALVVLGRLLLAGCVKLATLLKKSFCSNSSVW